jgi:hypothetical protein
VKETTSNAPVLLQKLLNTLSDKIPGILYYTSDNVKIDLDDFPKAKDDFDRIFGTTITTGRQQKLLMGFQIRSDQTFYNIKTSVWSFLKKHTIYMKKHPGPLNQMDLVTAGWIHKAHPIDDPIPDNS